MEYRKLGPSGLKVSTLCLGTMTFGEADALRSAALRRLEAAGVGALFRDEIIPTRTVINPLTTPSPSRAESLAASPWPTSCSTSPGTCATASRIRRTRSPRPGRRRSLVV